VVVSRPWGNVVRQIDYAQGADAKGNTVRRNRKAQWALSIAPHDDAVTTVHDRQGHTLPCTAFDTAYFFRTCAIFL